MHLITEQELRCALLSVHNWKLGLVDCLGNARACMRESLRQAMLARNAGNETVHRIWMNAVRRDRRDAVAITAALREQLSRYAADHDCASGPATP